MKKLMSILLVVLMLIPLIASCGGNDVTTTTEMPTTETPTTEAPTTEAPTTEAPTTEAPTTEAPTTEAPTTEAPSTIAPNAPWSSKTDIRDTWSGKTLNVACSTSYATGWPWAMPETFITEENDANFGPIIQNAVLDRNEFIEKTYGVKVKWLNTTQAGMPDALEKATLAKNVNYDLAAPRMMNVQPIVAGGYVYDLAGREFIDFDNSYYRDESIKAYTAHGHTFFVTGGFSQLDIETASVLLFNKDLLTEEEINDIYDMVRKGEWTYDKLFNYVGASYRDDGNGFMDSNDIYGMLISSFSDYYDYFGIKTAGVNQTTGQWELTINDERIDDVISAISESVFDIGEITDWFAHYSQESLVFLEMNLAQTYAMKAENIGVVPFPMLNKEQGRYYVPCSMLDSVAMCIPKITQDRAMSEYFMDVLCWTGDEYMMKAYIEAKKERFKDDVDIEMLTEYIIPNISYDVGGATVFYDDDRGTVTWAPVISIKDDSYKGNKNNFDRLYEERSPEALKTIAKWNAAWGGYTEE